MGWNDRCGPTGAHEQPRSRPGSFGRSGRQTPAHLGDGANRGPPSGESRSPWVMGLPGDPSRLLESQPCHSTFIIANDMGEAKRRDRRDIVLPDGQSLRFVARIPWNHERRSGPPVEMFCGACGRSLGRVAAEDQGQDHYGLAEYGTDFMRDSGPNLLPWQRGPQSGHRGFVVIDDSAPWSIPQTPQVLPGLPGVGEMHFYGPNPWCVWSCGCGTLYRRRMKRTARRLYLTKPATWTLMPDGRDRPGAPTRTTRHRGPR
jgi:hypothetical protein